MKKNMFINRSPNGTVVVAIVDDRTYRTAQEVAELVRQRRFIEYGAYKNVVIGKKLE